MKKLVHQREQPQTFLPNLVQKWNDALQENFCFITFFIQGFIFSYLSLQLYKRNEMVNETTQIMHSYTLRKYINSIQY